MQLNEARYGAAAFEAAGIRHFALEFPDCTALPDHIVKAFLAAVDFAAAAAVGSGTRGWPLGGLDSDSKVPGRLVGVHCQAGQGPGL
jgi:hypothetical protein